MRLLTYTQLQADVKDFMNYELYTDVKNDHHFLPIYTGRQLMEDHAFTNLDKARYYYVYDLYRHHAMSLTEINYDEVYEECRLNYSDYQSLGDNTYYNPMTLNGVDEELKRQLIDKFGEEQVMQYDDDGCLQYLLEEMLFALGFKQLYTKLCQAQ